MSLQQGKEPVHFVLIGGFLGAGKTTCIGYLTDFLIKRGLRIGLIANDQGVGLVDGERFRARKEGKVGVSSREITGGCFCCKADELVETLRSLSETEKPDVIVAEPVGSCTDLVATVVRPMQQVYQNGYQLAPMSVVVDVEKISHARMEARGSADLKSAAPRQASGRKRGEAEAVGRIANPRSGVGGFSAAVTYIYRKQMEEAEILVLNKVDLLSAARRKGLVAWVKAEFPGKRVLEVSTKTGEGLEEWFELMLTLKHESNESLEVDYDLYARGEALLGWYNAELSVHAVGDDFDGNKLLLKVAGEVQAALVKAGAGIAHFKMSLERGADLQSAGRTAPRVKNALGGVGRGKAGGQNAPATLGIVQVVANGGRPLLSEKLGERLAVGRLLVNLRAEGEPHILRRAVEQHLQAKEAHFVMLEQAAFKPGRPVPVHRIDGDGKADTRVTKGGSDEAARANAPERRWQPPVVAKPESNRARQKKAKRQNGHATLKNASKPPPIPPSFPPKS